MVQENHLLSSAQLKDRAKGALDGKYKKAVPALFLIGLMTLAVQLAVELIASFFFSLIIISREILQTSLSPEQLLVLLQETSYLEEYTGLYSGIDYVIQALAMVFTSVFQVGLSFYCLNLACGREVRAGDIFYGFRNQFKKALSISAVFVLVSQLCSLPSTVINYLISSGEFRQYLPAACGILFLCLLLYVPLSLGISQTYMLMLDFPNLSATELIKLSINIMKGQKLRLFLIQLSFIPLILLSLLTFGIGDLWLNPYMNVTYAYFFLNLMQAREATVSPQTC